MKKYLLLAATAAPVLALATPANAAIIQYNVTNATGGSCPHGLWTNDLYNRQCKRKFAFQDGTMFTQDTNAGTATFMGTAINSLGHVATLNLSFSGFQDALLPGQDYKKGVGGLPYDPATMDFYSMASGSIDIFNGSTTQTYSLNPADPLTGDTTLQIGPGANYFSSDFGGSAWLNILDPSGKSIPHWDINFDLALKPGTPVPAPGGLALFGLALMGLWAARRRRTAMA